MARVMKDSGVEWIGQIPEGWNVKRLKLLLVERKEINNPIKTNFILSLTNSRGVIPYSEKGDVGNKSKDDLTGYKLAYPNDIVLNSMNVIIGSVGLSKYFGAVSPVYYMLYTRNKKDSISFYNYIFQTQEFQNSLRGYGNGILEIRMRIQMSKLNTVLLPTIDSEQQHKIANYLDIKCCKIDEIIEKEKEVIEKLKAYKQSLITEVVTKGLNPDVVMKDSGVEWIGEVPNHWIVGRVKDCTIKIGSGKTPKGGADVYSNEGILFIRSQNVYSTGLKLDEATYISEEIDTTMKGTRVYFGDVLLNITGGSIGRSCIYTNKENHANVNQHVCIIRVNEHCCARYMNYFWISNVGKVSIDIYQSGANREGMNFEQIANTTIPVPNIIEQEQISNYLDEKCSKIERLIKQKEQVIEKLTEYKKSLIYECVTGKIEVRER